MACPPGRGRALVDAAHEKLGVRPSEPVLKMGKRTNVLLGCDFRFLQTLDSIGLLALAPNKVSRMRFGSIPEEVRETYVRLAGSDTGWFETAREEVASPWGNLAAQISTLHDIPLIVLSTGRGQMSAGPADLRGMWSGWRRCRTKCRPRWQRCRSKGDRSSPRKAVTIFR